VSATKAFGAGPERVVAVNGASISVHVGATVGIVGPSGSGKTTLLNMMGLIEVPTSGKVFFEGQDADSLSPSLRRRIRLAKIGFVFQQLRLIPTLSARENIELPMTLAATPPEKRKAKAAELVKSMGLQGKEGRRPHQLSVGEQQRVSVARALANDPVLILADEPTSQLDSKSGLAVLDLLMDFRGRNSAAVVITTHDPKICEMLGTTLSIRDGLLAPTA
jgi:putative ABC transport system ATP-binding protein